jgi:hypothetical protein
MVRIIDEGSIFDAPIETVWKFIFGGGDHDKVHTTTRNGKFQNVSDCTILYTAERNHGGKWRSETMRLSFFPPVATVQEWLKGPFAGSKWIYVYTPVGKKTRIDVYGEFTSKAMSPAKLRAFAKAFLDSEFADDAPAIRKMSRSK